MSSMAPALPKRLRKPARPHQKRRRLDVVALAIGLGVGGAVALPLRDAATTLAAPGGAATLLGDITAMAGTFLLLVVVLLAGRLPFVERVAGQDRLLFWHRRLAALPLVLLGAHGVFSTLGYVESLHSEMWTGITGMVMTMAWLVAAIAAYVLLVIVAILSIRAVRRHMSYDTWWVIHLYSYLAIGFSVPHQVIDGSQFAGRPLVQALWLALFACTGGAVALYRIGVPLARSLRHQLRVVAVQPHGDGVYSLVVRGRRLDALKIQGGQYFLWRFLRRDMWWHAHAFSLSAMPQRDHMRITIAAAGDTTTKLARIRTGTRMVIEGPYGVFTDTARTRRGAALIGAGVGITPLRALLEDMPHEVDVVVVQRASREQEMVHHEELELLLQNRPGRVVALPGSRWTHRLDDWRHLQSLVPDLPSRDVYVCGPEGFTEGVVRAAQRLGVAPSAIHRESFEF